MDVASFRAALQRERGTLADPDEPRVRAGFELCELYGNTDPRRFEAILVQLANGPPASAVSQGARWLLARWRASLPRSP
jgi:hypothetical protein